MAEIAVRRLDSIRAAPVGKVVRRAEYQRIVEAEAAIAAIEQDAKALFERTRDEALEEAQSQAEHAANLRALKTTLATVEYMGDLEQNLVGLVKDAVRRIVGNMPPGEAIVGMIGNLIGELSAEHHVHIKVAPEQSPSVKANLGQLERAHPHIKSLEVAPDPKLHGTQCRLETPLGILETSIDDLVETLEQALTETFQESRPEGVGG